VKYALEVFQALPVFASQKEAAVPLEAATPVVG
jgi:hypothetical protein